MTMERNEVISRTQWNWESSTQWLSILTFILRSFTFANLLHKLWEVRYHRECLKPLSEILCSKLSDNIKNQLWYFQHYPISNGLLFSSFMTSCLTAYRYSYFERLFLLLLVSGYFCGMCCYAVVPTYRSEVTLLAFILTDFRVYFNFYNWDIFSKILFWKYIL